MSGRIRLEAEERTEPTRAPEPAQPPPHAPEPPPPPPEPEPAAAPPAPSEGQGEASQADAKPQPELPAEVQKRLDRLNWEKYEFKRQRDEMQQAWQAEQARLRAAQQPQGQQDPEERALNRFRQEASERDFMARCNRLFQKGSEEYPNFGEARDRLLAVGYGNRPDALAFLAARPDGHHVYYELAQDLDRAAHVLSLPPADMVNEFADIAAARRYRQQPNGNPPPPEPTAPVTRAPAPLRPVGGNSARSEVPLEKTSMADFIRRRDRDERGSSRIRR